MLTIMCFVRFLTILLHCLLHFNVNGKIYNEFPWNKAEKALTMLCPPLEICGHELNGTLNPEMSCCSGCLCEEDCVSTGTCCLVDKEFQEYRGECVYPRTKYHNVTLDSREDLQPYIIINKHPSNGCDIKHGSGCSQDDFTKLSPVSDEHTGRVYFNEDCAMCHGVLDTKPWEPVFNCLHVIRVDRIDIAHELYKYFSDPEQSPCFFTFIPNSELKVRDNACHITRSTEWVFESSEKLKAVTRLNMTIGDIKDLCFSNINMPFTSGDSGRGFINPFCYLYDGGRVVGGCRLGEKNLNPQNYGMLLDYGKVKQFQTMDKTRQTSTEQVCRTSAVSPNVKQVSRCRHTHCPTGHLLGENGQCVLITNNFLVKRSNAIPLSVNIKLTPANGDNYPAEHLNNITVDDIRQVLPWPESWIVIVVAYIPVNSVNQTVIKSDLVVRITLKNGSLESSLARMLSYMRNPVSLDIDSHVIQFSQSFYHQVVRKTKTVIKGSDLNLPDDVLNVFQPWTLIDKVLSDPVEGMVISKLYFCKQIELQLDEFELYVWDRVLYNNVTESFMYELEFKILRNDIGYVTKARLCASDAGFVPSAISFNSTASLHNFSLSTILIAFTLN